MTPNQQSAYSLLRENPDLPADKLAEKVGCSARQAANYRKQFKEGTLGTPKPSNLKPVPDLPKATRIDPIETRKELPLPKEPIDLTYKAAEERFNAVKDAAPVVLWPTAAESAATNVEPVEHGSRLTKLMVWGAFALGIGMSVVANVAASWHGGDMARIAAATAPLAFMFAVEIIQRVRWPQGWVWQTARFGGAGLVAAVAAVSSYLHQLTLLQSFEHSDVIPYILPLAIDGLIVVSSAALIAMSKREK